MSRVATPASSPAPARRPSLFVRLAGFCHDRRRWVAGAWVAGLVLIGVLSGAAGNDFQDEFDLPASDSKTGFDILDRDFGGQGTGITGTIVFRAEQGVDDPNVKAAMEALFARSRRSRTSTGSSARTARRAAGSSRPSARAPARSRSPRSRCRRTSASPTPEDPRCDP